MTIINEYLENIEFYYKASDYYCFPVRNPKYCIDLPFSIVESLACGTPVLSTPFGVISSGFTGIQLIRDVENWNVFKFEQEGVIKPNIVDWNTFFTFLET